MNRTLMILAAAACVAVPAHSAAQQAFGPSVQAAFGAFTGGGSGVTNRGGPALDAVLAVPVARTGAGTLVAAVTAGISGPTAYDLVCEAAPGGDCLAEFPTLFSLGVAAGVQRSLGGGLSGRVLAGPAYYHAADGPNVAGVESRADVAVPLAFRTALVASVRGAVLPRYEGETLTFAVFGLGLRVQ